MGSDKRTRLIEAANKLIHQQGFNLTTLADIARESEVPLGNVYYYFKTKEEIGSALIEHRANFYRGMIESWNRLPDPKQRLAALIEMVSGERETLAQSGCPIGSLCQELHKDGGPLADKSASLMAAISDGTLNPVEPTAYPLTSAREALIATANRGSVGKLSIVPD